VTPSDPTSPARWQRIKELYSSAAERRPEKRDAFLWAACGGDEALRGEINRLLRQSSSDGPLDRPAWDAAVVEQLTAPGAQLGRYQVLERIGAGGMGEVYKARDPRLDRTVAIKLLRGVLSEAPEFRRRFEREARATSALNHPHICALHDVGEQAGILYLVMEYVDGRTLAERLRKGPLPFEQVLACGAQVADALAAAHARGIVHRDLKPANIMLGRTSGGSSSVKVLDFGLAKVESREDHPAASNETLTGSHAFIGTLAYMAPEQLEGEAADPRTDIFALGLLLYEMAAGRKPFEARSEAGTVAEVMHGEPRPMEGVPPRFERLVKLCLARDPASRWQSAADVKLELEDIRDHASEAAAQHAEAVQRPRARRRWALAAAGLGALLLAFAAGVFVASSDMPDQSQYRFTPFAFDPGGQSGAVWSPDGKAVAYRARGGEGSLQVFVRRLDSDVPVEVTHIPEAVNPFSPLAWRPDSHRILFVSSRRPGGIWSVAAVGGDPEPVFAFDFNPTQPPVVVAPDGKAAAVFCRDERGVWGLCISSPLGSPLKRYSPEPFATAEVTNRPALSFSPHGDSILLLFDDFISKTRQAWLLPYPADPKRPPRPVLPKLPGYGFIPSFGWAPDSRHIVLSLGMTLGQLWEADVVSGKRRLALGETGHAIQPAVSPDGRRILFTQQVTNYDIVSAFLDGSAPVPLIATERNELMPAWAAKQPVLVYVTDRNGPQEIWVRSGNAERPVVTARDFPPGTTIGFMGPALSPQAERVVYKRMGSDNSRLWISATAGGALIPLTNDTVAEYPGSWSPDGAWFTYIRGKEDSPELMKVRATGQAAPEVVKSRVRVGIPSWSPTGEWIAVRDELISPDGKFVRPLGTHGSMYYMFSADGKLVYGIRPEGDRNLLFSVDIAGNTEKIIRDLGAEFRPGSSLSPGIRFSLAPDGKSFVYGIGKTKSNLWLLEGFNAKTGILAHLGFR